MTHQNEVFAVIMAGGTGTRFWPLSSSKRPKQFLALTGKRSQIQLTSDRLNGIVKKSHRYVIGTQALEKSTRAHLPGIKILAEPIGRNTMAAVCWGAWAVAEINPQAVVIVLPADAHITDVKKFKEAILEAVSLAQNKKRIVCLGIKPTFAATGYGYIQNGEPLQNGHTIARFIEKPPVEKAAEYFETGEYTWNAGIFVFNVSVLKEEVREHSAEFAKFFDENVLQPKNLKSKYKSLPKISVDVALMEKSRKGAVVKGDFGWNDIGSWRALEEVLTQGPEGVLQTPGGHLALDCEGLIVNASPGKFVGLIGLKDLIIVETKDALLVCPKERAEQVKDLVGLMEKHSKWKKRL